MADEYIKREDALTVEHYIRRVDDLHRIQLPRDVWQELKIQVGDAVVIWKNMDTILIQKNEQWRG